MQNNNYNAALDWDSEIENDGQFVLLPAGDYNFQVVGCEKASFPGSQKMCACPKAVVNIDIIDGGQTAHLKVDLILHSLMEWRLAEFFRAIGQKKSGEKMKPAWNKIVGSTGRCKVGVRKYITTSGNEAEINEVLSFYDKVSVPSPYKDEDPFAEE